MMRFLSQLVFRLPQIRRLIAARENAVRRFEEMRDEIGIEWLRKSELSFHQFEPLTFPQKPSRRIAHVNYRVRSGGAAAIAKDVMNSLDSTWESWFYFSADEPPFSSHEANIDRKIRLPDTQINSAIHEFGRKHGHRGFCSPNSKWLLEEWEGRGIGIVHLHNLHPDYFNLFHLPQISHRFPTVWTLHDEYAFTGHCAFTLDCDGWRKGCPSCPYLTRYVETSVDNSAQEFSRKKAIYQKSKLNVVCVSNWLASRVRQSILGNQNIRVIRNGVNTEVFAPLDRRVMKMKLGIPQDAFTCVYCADGGRNNPWKGGDLLSRIIPIGSALGFHFIEIGGQKEGKQSRVHQLGNISEPTEMAKCLSAADLFLYPTKADSFGLAVAEAMSCGLPVVASRVGGVPEIVNDGETGVLIDGFNPEDFLSAVKALSEDKQKCEKFGKNGRKRIEEHFDAKRMQLEYRNLDEELYASQQAY